MVRATLSYCALFGSLIAVVALLQQSPREARLPASSPASARQSADGKLPAAASAIDPRAASEQESAGVKRADFQSPAPVVMAERGSHVRLAAFEEDAADFESEPPLRIRVPSRATIKDSLSDIPGEEGKPERSDSDATSDDEPAPKEAAPAEDAPTEDAPTEDAAKEPAKFPLDSEDAEEQISPELIELREKIRDCLGYYYRRPENVASRSPWGCMHWMIAYGVDAELIAGNRKVNAIAYLNYNGVCNGQSLFYTQNGQIQANIGPGVQGHAGQYLAMLAQSRVKTDYPLLIDGQKFTVADLIEYEKRTCRPQTELTFKLIALSHYLKSDEKWVSVEGETWDIQRLIKEELAQPIIGAACGGTHRLTGFSLSVRKREQRKEPVTGQWMRAKKFIEDYHEYAWKLQNPDGSFSTNWFAGREDNGPPTRRLETTGHITEWLAFSLLKEDLTDPRMVKSVDYLATLLMENRSEKWGIGPLGHGLHALAIYDERMFQGQPGKRAEQLAGRPKTLSRSTRPSPAGVR